MAEKHKYRKMYEKFVAYEESLHQQNQKKIRIGLKVNIILPLFFLFLSFVIAEGKLVFLIMWILSLFGIAFYLVYVEYTDYTMMEKMKEFGVDEDDMREEVTLIGEGVQQAETNITERLDYADERIEESIERLEAEKRRIEEELAERKDEISEKKEQLKETVIQRINEKTDLVDKIEKKKKGDKE